MFQNTPMPDIARSRAILLVEDEPSLSSVLQRHLEHRGYTVTPASSAEEGVRLLGSRRFDCVVLDNGLPGEMGITALPEIVSRTDAPVIMISGFADEDAVKDALLLGAKAFLPKPLDVDALEERIAQLCQGK